MRAGPHVQTLIRFRDFKRLKKDVGHLYVIVLACMDENLLETHLR
jgi:hypothetical protein